MISTQTNKQDRPFPPFGFVNDDQTPEIHETIFKLLDKRASRSSIFNFLQDHNFFDENADRPSFVRALTRLEKRHGRIHVKASSPTKPSKPSTVISAPLALPSRRSEIPVDVEYERDGKQFTVLKGVEREVPEGSHVLRGAIVPKLVIESVSMRNGTVIEDAEKHEQMAKEFEKLWESGMEKEDFKKCRFPIDDNAPIGAWFVRDGKYYAVNFAGEEVCIPPGYNFIRDKCRPIPPDEKPKNDDDEFVNFSDYPKYIQNVIRVSGLKGVENNVDVEIDLHADRRCLDPELGDSVEVRQTADQIRKDSARLYARTQNSSILGDDGEWHVARPPMGKNWEWIQKMQAIHAQSEEIVLNEMIYV